MRKEEAVVSSEELCHLAHEMQVPVQHPIPICHNITTESLDTLDKVPNIISASILELYLERSEV